MASRSGFPAHPPSPGASLRSSHVDSVIRGYGHDQVVYALMTQLKEKESELASMRAAGGGGGLINNALLAEKDTRIAVLEKQLAEGKDRAGSVLAEARLKRMTDAHVEHKRQLAERDEELSVLRPLVDELTAKVDDYEGLDHARHTVELREELARVNGELAAATERNDASGGRIEDLEKKLKGKEWVIKSLKEESADQQSREHHLIAHIKTLDEKLETYETKFKGKGVDVPILLAKLRDYEVRVKDLQVQVRRLTNKKLNELVLRSGSPAPQDLQGGRDGGTQGGVTANKAKAGGGKSKTTRGAAQQRDDDNESKQQSIESSSKHSLSDNDDEGEEGTYASEDDTLVQAAAEDEDVFTEFFSDVKVGIESLKMDGLCCVQEGSTLPVTSPLSDDGGGGGAQGGGGGLCCAAREPTGLGVDVTSPLSERSNHYDGRSPLSYNSSRTDIT